jgi:hypothetical protein
MELETGWRKSSFSGNGGANCVETASGNGAVMVRDTVDRGGVSLAFSADVWANFTVAVGSAA